MSKLKNILVTGGAGFIGSKIVHELLKDSSNQITVMDNLSTGLISNLEDVRSNIHFIQEDVRNLNLLKRTIDNKDIVYHMAAEVGVDRVMKKDTEVCELDYLAALNLFNIAAKAGVKTLLFASTSEAYGKFPQDRLPMKEDDAFTPDTVYGWAKYGAELKLEKICENTDMAGVSVRYFNVYGPGQTLNGYCVPYFIDAALKNEDIKIHGDGSQTRDLTYLDEAVKMTLAITNPKNTGEVFNIGTQTEITMNDLANKIIQLTNSKSKIVSIPPRRPTDLYHKMGDATKIFKRTGIRSETSLEEGLIMAIKYHEEKMKKSNDSYPNIMDVTGILNRTGIKSESLNKELTRAENYKERRD